MPINDGDQKSTEAIRMRAQDLAASGDQHTAEAEVLAAMADGTLSFDQVDEETVRRCIETFGCDSVVSAFLSAGDDSIRTEPQILHAAVDKQPQRPERIRNTRFETISPRSLLRSWWNSRLSWVAVAAAAAVLIVGTLVFRGTRSPTSSPETTIAENNIAPQWPGKSPFDPSTVKKWGIQNTPLPTGMPDFNKGPSTLGASGTDRFDPWRLATVIVRSETGWGSGAFISGDGWLLSNYHVVADAAQRAALTGQPASVDVITDRILDGRTKPQPALKATLYRADPVHDLALLKLDALPQGQKHVNFFPMGSEVRDGEDCFVIGSQNNGPAWWIRSGNVSQQFDYPQDLSQFAAGVSTTSAILDRDRVTVIVTDARISPGDSGGPLLNANGKLIGLTFATPANTSAGSVGWHIALPHLRNFVANLPPHPEGVPFDPWTAGLPEATVLEPELVDADRNGHTDSLLYRYASRAPDGESQPLALTVFVDLAERETHPNDEMERVPYGLWGMEDRGQFRFNLFVTVRADQTTAVGYTNAKGIVNEIRLGSTPQGAKLIWNQNTNGGWVASKPSSSVPLIDATRFSKTDMSRLHTILVETLAPRERSPNKRP
jgi:S1-C subfamily serine protease